MKKYMVIIKDDQGEQFANFFDSLKLAENCRMNSECGMGWYAAIYEWTKMDPEDPYEPESYIEI